MGVLVAVMLLSFRTREHAVELGRFVMLAGLVRAGFGLARWAFAGGDPNNIYANMNDIHIKLTFFDINDSMLCTMAFAVAAVSLFQANKRRQGTFWWLVEWATLGATVLCVVLSYRRSAWIGFVLAGLIVMMRFPLKRRIQLAVLGTPVIGAGLLYAAVKRLGQTKGAGHGLSSLVYDMESKRVGPESERVLELKLALGDFLSRPFTGIGTWGRYNGYQLISWQEGADGGRFLHSGILHIALKAGLPGLALLFGTIGAFLLAARRALRTLPPDLLPLASAGAAGLAFMLPDLLVGTPFPQVRTTEMYAICMALPYVALGVAHLPATEPAPTARRLNLVPAV
jgi:O-antigen ligase